MWEIHLNEVELPKIGAGDVAENALTNNTALVTLVDKFNTSLTVEEQDFPLDRQVVQIRDVIVYGRLLASEQQPPFRLWKFGRPKNGRVPVEFCHELTEEWLTVTNNMIHTQRQKAVDWFIVRGYKGLRRTGQLTRKSAPNTRRKCMLVPMVVLLLNAPRDQPFKIVQFLL